MNRGGIVWLEHRRTRAAAFRLTGLGTVVPSLVRGILVDNAAQLWDLRMLGAVGLNLVWSSFFDEFITFAHESEAIMVDLVLNRFLAS